jgi:hypothetical protein
MRQLIFNERLGSLCGALVLCSLVACAREPLATAGQASTTIEYKRCRDLANPQDVAACESLSLRCGPGRSATTAQADMPPTAALTCSR